MIDLAAIRRIMGMRVFAESDVGDVNIARCFLDDVKSATKARPVATRNHLHIYDDEAGTWGELRREEALSLIQAYDGTTVGYTKTDKKTGAEHDYTRPLRLSSSKCKGIYECLLASQDALDVTFFDDAARGVSFQNGFVTVDKSGAIALHDKSPETRQPTAQPFDYDPEAECPEWLAVLRRVFDGARDAEDRRKLLQEFVGACLMGIATNYTTCLVLIGEGANGKSVVAETIAELLFPPDAVTYTTPQSWGGRFTLSRLRNARLNVASEMPDAELAAADVFKAVVDGGRLEVEDKNKDPYTMLPRAGHLFLANAPPTTRDFSHGFWRRFLTIPFERDFSKEPDSETKEAVKAKLIDEAPGIMLWALHGAARLLKAGRYTVPSSHYRIIGDWRRNADQVAAFVDECCESSEPDTPAKDVYMAFREWCQKSGRKELSNNAFGRRLKSLGVVVRATRDGARYGLEVLPKSEWETGKVRDVMVGDGSILRNHHAKQPEITGLSLSGEGCDGFSSYSSRSAREGGDPLSLI